MAGGIDPGAPRSQARGGRVKTLGAPRAAISANWYSGLAYSSRDEAGATSGRGVGLAAVEA